MRPPRQTTSRGTLSELEEKQAVIPLSPTLSELKEKKPVITLSPSWHKPKARILSSYSQRNSKELEGESANKYSLGLGLLTSIPHLSLINYVLKKLFNRLDQLEPCCLFVKTNIHNQKLFFPQVFVLEEDGSGLGGLLHLKLEKNKKHKFWITTNFGKFTRRKHVMNSRIWNQSLGL